MPTHSHGTLDTTAVHAATLPVLSIVMYFIKPAPYLDEALTSIVSQLTPAVELVVVAGHARDEPLDIAPELRVKIDQLIIEPDHGAWDAANKGWRAARGKWVQFFMSDDWLPEGSIARTLAALPSHANAEIISGGMSFTDANGRLLRRFPAQALSLERVLDKLCSPGVIYRRDLLDNLGGFDRRFPYAHDRELLLRIWRHHAPHATLSHEIYSMRMHILSRTTSGDPRIRSAFLREHVEFADELLAATCLPAATRHKLRHWRDEELVKYRFVRRLARLPKEETTEDLPLPRFLAAALRVARRRVTRANRRW
jgi:glycosyltransferase involved in cell wall biosynthesis